MSTHRRRTKPQDQDSSLKISPPALFLWAVIGLLLTIIATFIEVFMTNSPWQWAEKGIHSQSLGITYQIGAVLLTGCMGGKNAGALSQIAYVMLGLFWLPVFAQGGGIDYLYEPSFGYLLGFIPGAWLCGWLAFRQRPKIEWFAFSSLGGLLVIHICGLGYLLSLFLLKSENSPVASMGNLRDLIYHYSISPFLGQLIIVCVISVLAFLLRKLLFY